MGTLDRYSPHPPTTLSDHSVIVSADSISSSAPENMNLKIAPKTVVAAIGDDHPFAARSCLNNTSCISIEDDSSHATITGTTSSFNNDSDCETISSNGSKYQNCTSNSSTRNDGSASSFNSRTGKNTFDRMDEATSGYVDKLFIEELQGLSVRHRDMVQEEIHGVHTCAVSEDEEKIVEGLKRLDEEIRAIRQEVLVSPDEVSVSGDSYNESIWEYLAVEEENSSTSPASTNAQKRILYSYIFHRDFRLKFLRADLFDVEKAAHRYLRRVECLLNYYGSYALQRPLMYDDLGKECQDAAKVGYGQILPSRDRAGRLIVVSQAPLKSKRTSMATIVKLFTYIFQTVSEDIETQKRGVIFIFTTNDDALELLSDPASKKEYSMYTEGSPVRRSCTHFCLPENNPKMNIIRAIIMMAMSREERIRTRIHMEGLTTETQYTLMTFGIPVSELPITSTGAIKIKHHMQWIKTRKAIDASRMKSLEESYDNKMKQQQKHHHLQAIASQQLFCVDFCTYPPTFDEFLKHHGNEPITYPLINDVLFSKGGKNVTHYGNIEFTDLMKRSLTDYISGTPVQNRKMRKAIRQSIIDEVQARGGRFLTLDKNLPGGYCWTEIENGPDLHDRIATSLYDHKRRLAAKLKVKTHRCGTDMFTQIGNSSKRCKFSTDDGQPISCCDHGYV